MQLGREAIDKTTEGLDSLKATIAAQNTHLEAYAEVVSAARDYLIEYDRTQGGTDYIERDMLNIAFGRLRRALDALVEPDQLSPLARRLDQLEQRLAACHHSLNALDVVNAAGRIIGKSQALHLLERLRHYNHRTKHGNRYYEGSIRHRAYNEALEHAASHLRKEIAATDE